MSSDIKKYLGVYSKNIYVLMAVAATCAIVSQSEKTDAMFRNVLNRAGSIISGVSSNSSTAGARRAITGARTAMGTPSNPLSTETAPGKVVHDHTGGGTGVFTTNAWGRRLYYGESDASKLSKHLGSNVDVDAKYNMYYDADGTPVVTMTKSGKLMRTLAHSEIVRGVFEDPETGQKSQRIVIAGPWWVSGADIKMAGLSSAKSPKDTEGAGVGTGKPVIPSVTVGVIQTTATSSVDASTQTDIDTSSSSNISPVKKVSIGVNTDITGDVQGRLMFEGTDDGSSGGGSIPPAPPLPSTSATESSGGIGSSQTTQSGITSEVLLSTKDNLKPSKTNEGKGNTGVAGAHGVTPEELINAKYDLKKVEITERSPLDESPGAHGITPEQLLVSKLLLKPTVIIDKTQVGGSVVTDNTGKIITRVTSEEGTSAPSGANTPTGSVVSSGGQSFIGPVAPPPTEASSSGSTTPTGSTGLQPVPPLPTSSKDYSGYNGTEVTPNKLQTVGLRPTVIKEKGGVNGTSYKLVSGYEIIMADTSGDTDQPRGASNASTGVNTPSSTGATVGSGSGLDTPSSSTSNSGLGTPSPSTPGVTGLRIEVSGGDVHASTETRITEGQGSGGGANNSYVSSLNLMITGDGRFVQNGQSSNTTGIVGEQTSEGSGHLGGQTYTSTLNLRFTSDGRFIKEGEQTTGIGGGQTSHTQHSDPGKIYTSTLTVTGNGGRGVLSTGSQTGTTSTGQTSGDTGSSSSKSRYTSTLNLKVDSSNGVITITPQDTNSVNTQTLIGSGQS